MNNDRRNTINLNIQRRPLNYRRIIIAEEEQLLHLDARPQTIKIKFESPYPRTNARLNFNLQMRNAS